MKTKIILVGGGGHCQSCVEVIESTGLYDIAGILDRAEKRGQLVCGYPIVGTDDDIDRYVAEGYSFLITVGQVKSAAARQTLFKRLQEKGCSLPAIVASTAMVSRHARLMPGCIVMHRAVVNAGAVIGENSIINTCANIEHQSVVGACCHISTGVMLNGDCRIGDHTFVGSGTTIINGVTLPAHTVIGAGSVVLHSVAVRGIYAGNPLKKIE